MSNIAEIDLSRGFRDRHLPVRKTVSGRVTAILGFLVPGLLFAALLISLQPFGAQSTSQAAPETGSAVNQIGYSFLGLIAIAGAAMLAVPRRLLAAFDLFWIAAFAILAISTLPADDTVSALKTLIFTGIIILTCIGILTIPRNENQLCRALLIGIGAAVGLSYLGVLLLPHLAVHSAQEVEFLHAGLWRGHFSHKNIAGPVMAIFVFFGIYFARAGYRFAGIAIAIMALWFVMNTGSKTTIGLMPLTILIVIPGALLGLRWTTVIAAVLLLTAVTALTLGTMLWEPLAQLSEKINSDPTFTGRTSLWAFSLENITKQFWTGFGYDGFWLKPGVLGSDLPFDAEWDYRETVHGHNNYLDIMLAVGVPAGTFMILMLCIRPLFHYATGRTGPANRRLADLFLMIVLFAALNSHLESFWFRRADPVWMLMVVGVIGLRLTSRLRFEPLHR